MVELGKMEDEIFKERKSRELRFREMDKARKRSRQLESYNAPSFMTQGQFAPHVRPFYLCTDYCLKLSSRYSQALGGQAPNAVTNPKQQAMDMRKEGLEWNKNKNSEGSCLTMILSIY